MANPDPNLAQFVQAQDAAAASAGTPPLTDAAMATAYSAQAPTARQGPVWVTYTYLSTRTDLFGAGAINVAGTMRLALTAWVSAPDLSVANAALPNPGALAIINDRLAGATGLDWTDSATPGLLSIFASGVDSAHPPILTSAQSAALLGMGWVVYSAVASDVTAARAAIAQQATANVTLTALEAYASFVRAQVNAYVAGTVSSLPTVPTPGGN
jgi:hypothetical protein